MIPTHCALVSYVVAARIIGGDQPVSICHIQRLIKAGKLRAIGRGKARRVVYASIIAYIQMEGNTL